MLLYPWFQAAKDKFIEHGHRLLGAVVGVIAIGLCIVVWLKDQRRWLGWLSFATLLLIVGQGILGGLRVLLVDVQIAKIHGCVAPLLFALIVAITVFTSRWWSERKVMHCGASGRLRRLAVLTFFLAYVQLVLGALLRHVSPSAPGSTFRAAIFFHLILAAVLLIDGIALCWQSQRHFKGVQQLVGPPRVLLLLLVIQLLLGAGAWVLKYSWPAGLFAETPGFAGWTNTAGGLLQASVVTGHVATGSLILGASLWTALRFFRGTTGGPAGVSTPVAHYSAMGVL